MRITEVGSSYKKLEAYEKMNNMYSASIDETNNSESFNALSDVNADSDVEVDLNDVRSAAFSRENGNSMVNVSYKDEDGRTKQKMVSVADMSIGIYSFNRFTKTVSRNLVYKENGVNISITQRFQNK